MDFEIVRPWTFLMSSTAVKAVLVHQLPTPKNQTKFCNLFLMFLGIFLSVMLRTVCSKIQAFGDIVVHTM